jgi:hypothetical protein
VPNQTLQALADKHGQARAIYGKDYKAVMGTVMKRIRTRGTARANVIAGK